MLVTARIGTERSDRGGWAGRAAPAVL